jgi:hypothetical protein
MIDHTAVTALRHFFAVPENHEAGAAVINLMLTQIEATGRRPRLTRDDFARLSEMFLLCHVPGPLDEHPQALAAKPDVLATLSDIAERTRQKAANGPRNDKNDLPEAGPPMHPVGKLAPPPR